MSLLNLSCLLFLAATSLSGQSVSVRWSSYFGGASAQLSYHAIDRQGNIILAGHTTSTTLPTTANAYQMRNSGLRDLFIAKLSPAGQLLWATYYGGSQDEFLDKVTTDPAGNIFLSGRTASVDFPRTTFVGSGGYVLSLDPNGQRRFALAGGGLAEILDLLPDASGNVLACGYTNDLGLPEGLLNYQTQYGGGARDGVIAALNSQGTPTLLTYFGGSGEDTVTACTADSRGVVYFSFVSNSPGFPSSAVLGFDPAQKQRTFTTNLNLGPTGYIYSMVLSNDSLWLTGSTGNALNVSANAVTKTAPAGANAFLARVSTGGQLTYNSYLGGNGLDTGYAINTDASGNVFVCGTTSSTDFPVTPNALNGKLASNVGDGFFNIHRSDGSIIYSTYLNGSGFTFCDSVTVSGTSVVVSGIGSNSLALVNNGTVQSSPTGASASWILSFNLLPSNAPFFTLSGVTNAASFSSGAIAPGEIVTLFAQGGGPAALAGLQLTTDRRVATTTGNTRVLFDGTPAPMVYSVQGQISAIVPYNVAGKSTVQVILEYNSIQSAPVTVPVVASAPALFSVAGGVGQVVAVLEAGCCNSLTTPAKRGEVIVLYATGEGQTAPAGRDGSLAEYATLAEFPKPTLPVSVTVGGKTAEILYAGAAPGFVAGLMQINLRIPADAPVGDQVPVVLKVGTNSSRDGVTLVLR